jgi:hypothetical protein
VNRRRVGKLITRLAYGIALGAALAYSVFKAHVGIGTVGTRAQADE